MKKTWENENTKKIECPRPDIYYNLFWQKMQKENFTISIYMQKFKK